MSLTSRLSSLFSQDTSGGTSIETHRNGYAEPDVDFDGPRQNKRPRTMEKLAEEEVDFELKRPPYIHVGAHPNPRSVFAHMISLCLLEGLAVPVATFLCTP